MSDDQAYPRPPEPTLRIEFDDRINFAMQQNDVSVIKSLVIDALLAIQGGQNPRVIESMLETYLPKSKRQVADEE